MTDDYYQDSAISQGVLDEDAKPNPLTVLPLKPFQAKRTTPDGDTLGVSVVGLRYDHDDEEWQFICIVESDGEIYVSEHNALDGDLPYSKS